MVLVRGQHASFPDVRDSILAQGLTPHKPTEDGRYIDVEYLEDQPRGVYLHAPEFGRSADPWGWCGGYVGPFQDSWLAAYCGPLIEDPIIDGAIVALEPVLVVELDTVATDSYDS